MLVGVEAGREELCAALIELDRSSAETDADY